ncbi:MAG: glycosyltransferase family 39 protein, partial [Acidobacteriota bacterium]|nr:glycosyltransferase family 39 protein [Acidobacteriota bacterium]
MFRRIQPSHLLLILGFVWILFFLGLGGLGLVGPDEPRYAQIAREMLASGDFVTPRYFGEPWLEKPVLYYWLAAAAYSIFGVNEFAARLPSALAAVLGVFCVYLAGRQREGPLE